MKVFVTKHFDFCYGHFLPKYDGKCAQHHGHNAALKVTVSNDGHHPDYPGMVLDFSKLKKIVQPLVNQLDHHFLNEILMETPTAENIAVWFFDNISKELPFGVVLEKVAVSETPDSWAEVVR